MPRHNAKTPEELAKWEAALDEGYSYLHVAEMFGVYKGTVSKYFPGRGWNWDQIQEHSRVVRRENTLVLG